MRQWAVDLSGEGVGQVEYYSYLYADWTVDLSLNEECVFCFMSAPAARIDGCCPCGVTATMR